MILVNNPGNWNTTFDASPTPIGTAAPSPICVSLLHFHHGRRHAVRLCWSQRRWSVASTLVWTRRAPRRMADPARPAAERRGLGAARDRRAVPGVLQRLGLVYLIAAPLVVTVSAPWRIVVLAVLVVGHWALLMIPISGYGALARTHNVSGLIDQAVFGRHLLTATGDPEGLLGTIPAVATALMGSMAHWIARARPIGVRVAGLVGGGLAASFVALAWAAVLPLNKSLWTGSFVLFTGGIATLALTAAYLFCDVYPYRRWVMPFSWLGLNALVIYFLAELGAHVIDTPWQQGTGRDRPFARGSSGMCSAALRQVFLTPGCRSRLPWRSSCGGPASPARCTTEASESGETDPTVWPCEGAQYRPHSHRLMRAVRDRHEEKSPITDSRATEWRMRTRPRRALEVRDALSGTKKLRNRKAAFCLAATNE